MDAACGGGEGVCNAPKGDQNLQETAVRVIAWSAQQIARLWLVGGDDIHVHGDDAPLHVSGNTHA